MSFELSTCALAIGRSYENLTKKKGNTMEIITQQQEVAYESYKEHENYSLEIGMTPLNFRSWYFLWCAEEGLFCDL